jgi:ribonuclease HII
MSIAAASVVAKVTRDRIMCELSLQYPEYGFQQHKGYPTAFHKEMIKKHGISLVHRKGFKGVKEYISV